MLSFILGDPSARLPSSACPSTGERDGGGGVGELDEVEGFIELNCFEVGVDGEEEAKGVDDL
jgi:hypothetical protein